MSNGSILFLGNGVKIIFSFSTPQCSLPPPPPALRTEVVGTHHNKLFLWTGARNYSILLPPCLSFFLQNRQLTLVRSRRTGEEV